MVRMASRYCTPEMHEDLSYENEIRYEVRAGEAFTVAGYRHLSTMLSVRTEAFIHAMPGQPISEAYGVEVGKSDVIPEGLEMITLRGGLWRAVSYPCPVPGDYMFDVPYQTP